MKKKFQVFISSTYTDLIEERQQAVKAVLDSNHIPAGMELFKANNQDQMDIIKQWIDESDVFMLILGGRYGSLDPSTKKSYTHLEYEYALKKKMPVFTLILTEQMIKEKISKSHRSLEEFHESKNSKKYNAFLEQVKTGSVVKFINNIYQIDSSVMGSLKHFEKDSNIGGWIRTNDNSIMSLDTLTHIENLQKEITQLKSKNNFINNRKVHTYTFDFSNVDPNIARGIRRAISDAANTIISIKDIKRYTRFRHDFVDMIELLQDVEISHALSVGIQSPPVPTDELSIFMLSVVLPFLEENGFVTQSFDFRFKNIITYRINSYGLSFFNTINTI